MSASKSLIEVLAQHSIEIVPDFGAGKQRNGSQWLFCHQTEIGGKTLQFAYFGDYKKDLQEEWFGGATELSEQEKKVFKKYIDEQSKARIEMQRTLWEERKLDAARFLKEQCTQRAEATPYLIRKKIPKLFPGTLVHVNEHGSHVLIIPMRDIDSVVWNYQRIYPEKLSKGDKFFLEEARIEGTFFCFGDLNAQVEKIYIAEGFATAASIYMAFNEAAVVVAAFNAGNLGAVSKQLRERFPNLKLIFCADNDRFTLIKGQLVNVGLQKARSAAADYQGEVVYPRFGDDSLASKPTDFNDLHALDGLALVHEQIKHPERFKVEGEIEPIICKGKPSEESIANLLVKEFGDRIVRQENDLFLYKQTHWVLCETQELILIRNMIRACCPGKLTSRDVDSAFKTFKDKIPHVPHGVNMFTPSPFIGNFNNGSVHLQRQSDGSFVHFVKPHSKNDFVTSCIPFDFLPNDTSSNTEFDGMLRRIWAGEADMEEKILRYGENLGSMFMAAFASITIYTGKPGTGKSTLLLIAAKLIDERNLCMVDPTAFDGFNMESMPGKLVNIVTDLNTHKPISDELVKMVTDRVKFRIRRKGLKDVYAFIPAVHLWACNALPKSFEGASKAMGRRVTIIETNKFQPVGLYNKEYHQWVFDQNPQGIINFAVQGLLRLIANKGHYTQPHSSQAQMEDWQLESDVVGRFMHEVKDGLISEKNRTVKLDPQARFERKMLWEVFLDWHVSDRGNAPKIGKSQFFKAVESKGYQVLTIKGVRCFSGIGTEVAVAAQF